MPFSIQILPIQLFQSSGCPELGPAMAGATRHFCASLRCSLSLVTQKPCVYCKSTFFFPEPFQENFRKIKNLAG
ncbi:hypothetical protein BB65665_08172 [Bacillus sp. 916]|nr:hypothetical protein KO64_04170 [Bacillus subtilis]EJD68075.1 hypothetical protein BB65665_08172 [Bacillus sp. 916]